MTQDIEDMDRTKVVISFTHVKKPYGWLGNMAAFPVTYEGQVWRTSEALFQALRFSDPNIRERIRQEKSPMGAKMKAKGSRDQMVVVPMSENDLENMRICLRLKFTQHPVLAEKLLRTADHTLIEDVTSRKGARHEFWGARRTEDHKWHGTNTLGKLLMELRSNLKFGSNL